MESIEFVDFIEYYFYSFIEIVEYYFWSFSCLKFMKVVFNIF